MRDDRLLQSSPQRSRSRLVWCGRASAPSRSRTPVCASR